MSDKNKFWIWVLRIAGAIFIGAIGSGVWELFLKDFFFGIGHILVGGLTFGLQSLQDSIYQEIAKGSTNKAPQYLLFLGMSMLAVIMGFMSAKRATKKKDKVEMLAEKLAQEKNLEELKKLAALIRKQADRWYRIAMTYNVLIFSFLFFRYIETSFVNESVTNFEQVYTICLPNLLPSEKEQVRSQFAQIQTKQDYDDIMRHLKEVAAKNNLRLPKSF
ncbi:MAG TPA: hypothetical protein VGM58_11115 [Verrucomicrobiae bacterium]|jgi:hypothetical protein